MWTSEKKNVSHKKTQKPHVKEFRPLKDHEEQTFHASQVFAEQMST